MCFDDDSGCCCGGGHVCAGRRSHSVPTPQEACTDTARGIPHPASQTDKQAGDVHAQREEKLKAGQSKTRTYDRSANHSRRHIGCSLAVCTSVPHRLHCVCLRGGDAMSHSHTAVLFVCFIA